MHQGAFTNQVHHNHGSYQSKEGCGIIVHTKSVRLDLCNLICQSRVRLCYGGKEQCKYALGECMREAHK